METYGDRVKKYREEHDISLRTFAEICNISPASVTYIENGRNGKDIMPKIEILKKIFNATGIEFDLSDEVQVGAKLRLTEDYIYIEQTLHALNADQLKQLRTICETVFPMPKTLIENRKKL